ncbi:MAG: zf-HC2 domain-containing protein [Nitrospirota bacterium]
MGLRHEDIKEKLPEYFSGNLSHADRAEIDRHLKGCPDCYEELALIAELIDEDVPEPGDFFWNSLPGKVIMLSKEREENRFPFKLLLKPLPLTACIILIAISLFFIANNGRHSSEYPYAEAIDPLSAFYIDYSILKDEDLAGLDEKFFPDDSGLNNLIGTFYDDSYHGDIVSLSSEEMDNLYQSLNNKKT